MSTVPGSFKEMGYVAPTRTRKIKLKQPSHRQDKTFETWMLGRKIYYGRRGNQYFFLCTCGEGRGFAYEADLIRELPKHSCTTNPTTPGVASNG